MGKTWLVVDVSNAAHRAFHTTGSLSHEGDATGVLFGVFRDLIHYQNIIPHDGAVFAFDSNKSLRKNFCVTYKANKVISEDPEALYALGELRSQIRDLREEYLPRIGYRNIFRAEGYEADDIIASICDGLSEGDKAVIVSSDHDLYQLLSDRVRIWLPTKKTFYTETDLLNEFGIVPNQWPMVKAIAGCSSDNVIGVRGVAEKTASKFLRGELKKNTKAYEAILKSHDQMNRNITLVKLPYKNCPLFLLRSDETNSKAWEEVLLSLGMEVLATRLITAKIRKRE